MNAMSDIENRDSRRHEYSPHPSKDTRPAQGYGHDASAESSVEDQEPRSDPDREQEISMYISCARATAALDISYRIMEHVVNAMMIDTSNSRLSTCDADFLPGLLTASVRRNKFQKAPPKNIRGMGGLTAMIGNVGFYFYFGGLMYRLFVHVAPGKTPFILSHKYVDDFGFNYQSKYNIIERPHPDGYSESVEMRGGVARFAQRNKFPPDQDCRGL